MHTHIPIYQTQDEEVEVHDIENIEGGEEEAKHELGYDPAYPPSIYHDPASAHHDGTYYDPAYPNHPQITDGSEYYHGSELQEQYHAYNEQSLTPYDPNQAEVHVPEGHTGPYYDEQVSVCIYMCMGIYMYNMGI
jgi:hypothetical protein